MSKYHHDEWTAEGVDYQTLLRCWQESGSPATSIIFHNTKYNTISQCQSNAYRTQDHNSDLFLVRLILVIFSWWGLCLTLFYIIFTSLKMHWCSLYLPGLLIAHSSRPLPGREWSALSSYPIALQTCSAAFMLLSI